MYSQLPPPFGEVKHGEGSASLTGHCKWGGFSPVRRLSQFQHVKCFQVTHLTNHQSTHTCNRNKEAHYWSTGAAGEPYERDPKSKRIVGTWGRSVTFHPEHRGLNRINSNWFRHLQNQYLILIWKGLFSIPKKSIKSIRNSMKKRAIINTKKSIPNQFHNQFPKHFLFTTNACPATGFAIASKRF